MSGGEQVDRDVNKMLVQQRCTRPVLQLPWTAVSETLLKSVTLDLAGCLALPGGSQWIWIYLFIYFCV